MTNSYDLTQLDEKSFEHMVNYLAMHEIGNGVTTFGPGPDGGRDGYFEGEAPYPSESEKWNGKWYIQSKFHRPHLTKNAQEWLLEQMEEELRAFTKSGSRRSWPDNWIVATNVDISAASMHGTFDKSRDLVKKYNTKLAEKFHIWSGNKIIGLLSKHVHVAQQYMHFITPGHVISSIYDQLHDQNAGGAAITRYLIVNQFDEQQYTKLEQAGSSADNRPGLQKLFIDLPYHCTSASVVGLSARSIASCCARNHQVDKKTRLHPNWMTWSRHPKRARIWFIKAGPGQGKSTITQFISQIHRAAFILSDDGPNVLPRQQATAEEIKSVATNMGLWPSIPRVPIYIELKHFAQWLGERPVSESAGVLTYIGKILSTKIEQQVLTGTMKRLFSGGRWLFIFDGLDEVPSDIKDQVAYEVKSFIDDILVGCDSDAMSICTSRPQGYSGQFSELSAAVVELRFLTPDEALECAKPILRIDRSDEEVSRSFSILSQALQTSSIQEIMKTPLQSHIMAIVVRDGGRPPERRWQLYDNFYKIVKKREANKASPNKGLAILLKDGDKLIKNLHNRLGFVLHQRAEKSRGANTDLTRSELSELVNDVVSSLYDDNIHETSTMLMEATTERLVLVNTPESGDKVRFDIRQLQEFFASEFMYEGIPAEELRLRLELIMGDQHWREIVHFALSALIENKRQTDLTVAVNVLSSLDDTGDDEDIRVYNKKMAVGGIIAARLLAENVLEQDKKDRLLFRQCFKSLFSSIDVVALYPLTLLKPSQSLSWLIEQLHEHLIEQVNQESVGAAYLAFVLVSDQHRRANDFYRIISNSPDTYKAIVFAMLVEHADEGEEYISLPKWSTLLIVESFCNGLHLHLNVDQVSGLARLLVGSPYIKEILFERFNVPIKYVDIFCELTNPSRIPDEKPTEVSTYNMGMISVGYQPFPSLDETSSWDQSTWNELLCLPGIFKAFSKLLLIYSTTDITTRQERLLDLLAGPDAVTLPRQWLTLMPERFLSKRVENLTPELREWITEAIEQPKYFYRKFLSITRLRDADEDQMREAIRNFPGIFIEYILAPNEHPFHSREEKQSVAEKYFDVIVDVLKKDPQMLLNNVHQWGFLVQLEENNGSTVRDLILQIAHNPARESPGFFGFTALALNLPTEKELLPHLAKSLTDLMWSERFGVGATFLEQSNNKIDWRGHIKDLSLKCVQNKNDLKNIMLDDNNDKIHKFSAAILYLLSVKTDDDAVQLCLEIVAANYDDNSPDWYLKAAGTAMLDLVPSNRNAVKSMGHLLKSARNDYFGKLQMHPVFQVWREKSSAPVSSANSNLF